MLFSPKAGRSSTKVSARLRFERLSSAKKRIKIYFYSAIALEVRRIKLRSTFSSPEGDPSDNFFIGCLRHRTPSLINVINMMHHLR